MMAPNHSHNNACRPPLGKTILTIGQDYFSIQEYILSQYNASLHRPVDEGMEAPGIPLKYFVPAATMVYTDIYQLRGLDHPADYGSGVEYAKGMVESFPDSGLQIGLWLNGTLGCQDIVAGVLDVKIHQLYDFIQNLPRSIPKVFLRVGYEFDNPWFGFSDNPVLYRMAFRKLVCFCETQLNNQVCHEKIAFVWHSWAAPRVVGSLDEFYPGDDIVDWVGVSIFQQLYPWANVNEGADSGNFAGGDMQHVVDVLEFAKNHDKPIMIAESTPFGGMDVVLADVATRFINNSTSIWDLWFQKTIDLIERYDISMWSYINCDWETQPMWHGIGFGDTRLSSSKIVMDQWWKQVLKNTSRFLHHIDTCDASWSRSHRPKRPVLDVPMIAMLTAAGREGEKNVPLLLTMLSFYLLLLCMLLALLLVSHRQHVSRQKFRDEAESLSQPDPIHYGSCQ